MTFAGGWIVIFLTETPRKLLQQPWTKTRSKQTKWTSGAATAKIWGPTSSEVSWLKCPSPSVSDPMELTSWWSHALHRWIPTSYLQVVPPTPPLDGCGFRRSKLLGEVMQEFLGADARVGKMEATRKVMSDHLSHWGMDFNIWHA